MGLREIFQERANNGPDLLIIGGGKNCENITSTTHQPHPLGCLTASLPDDRLGNWPANADIQGDVTKTSEFVAAVRAHREAAFKVVHIENIDNDVGISAATIASAHALLADDALLILECGALGKTFGGKLEERPGKALAHILSLFAVLGFKVEYSKADLGGICVAARKPINVVRITSMTFQKGT